MHQTIAKLRSSLSIQIFVLDKLKSVFFFKKQSLRIRFNFSALLNQNYDGYFVVSTGVGIEETLRVSCELQNKKN